MPELLDNPEKKAFPGKIAGELGILLNVFPSLGY
jgi:hypothetical protein